MSGWVCWGDIAILWVGGQVRGRTLLARHLVFKAFGEGQDVLVVCPDAEAASFAWRCDAIVAHAQGFRVDPRRLRIDAPGYGSIEYVPARPEKLHGRSPNMVQVDADVPHDIQMLAYSRCVRPR